MIPSYLHLPTALERRQAPAHHEAIIHADQRQHRIEIGFTVVICSLLLIGFSVCARLWMNANPTIYTFGG